MNTKPTTTKPAALVEWPAVPSTLKLTRAQRRDLANERNAWNIAARLGEVTESRMEQARKAVRAVVRAGRLSARVCEAENERANYDAEGNERRALRDLRARSDKADKAAADALAPFALRLSWPGLYPTVENADGRAFYCFPEY